MPKGIAVIKANVSRTPVYSHAGTGLNAMQLPTAAGTGTVAVKSTPARGIIKKAK